MRRASSPNLTKLAKWRNKTEKSKKGVYLLALFAFLAPFYLSQAQVTLRVSIEGMQFKPVVVRANVGDTIVWNNMDLVPHTVTASDKSFDSGQIGANGAWSLHLTKQGEIHYTCTIHPQMSGTLVVE